MGKNLARKIRRAFDLTFDKALESLRKQINAYPLKMRLMLCWRILWRKF